MSPRLQQNIEHFNLEHNFEHNRLNISTHSHVHNYTPYKVKKSTPSCSTDPKSVTPMQRVCEFPNRTIPFKILVQSSLMLQYTVRGNYHSLQHSVQLLLSYYKLFEHNKEVVEHNEVVLLKVLNKKCEHNNMLGA